MELPELYAGGYFYGDDKRQQPEQFTVDDLLDFSNEDALVTDAFFDASAGAALTDSSTVTAVDSCNSSVSGENTQFSGNRSFGESSQFSGDLCVPYDDLAELEWLSNFVEDSFSPENDLQAFQYLSTTATAATAKAPQIPETSSSADNTPPFFHHDTPLPGKARSRRSRAAPGDWTTRLLHLITPSHNAAEAKTMTSSHKKRENAGSNNSGLDSSGRKCLHCASEKTPQWRTGPMGPKTLCNACGVRYKSGRLVPEYRPAASPTFVSARHSNSHRKVLELRRQKEYHQTSHHQNQHQFLSRALVFGVSNGGDEFLIPHHHRGGGDYRQMM